MAKCSKCNQSPEYTANVPPPSPRATKAAKAVRAAAAAAKGARTAGGTGTAKITAVRTAAAPHLASTHSTPPPYYPQSAAPIQMSASHYDLHRPVEPRAIVPAETAATFYEEAQPASQPRTLFSSRVAASRQNDLHQLELEQESAIVGAPEQISAQIRPASRMGMAGREIFPPAPEHLVFEEVPESELPAIEPQESAGFVDIHQHRPWSMQELAVEPQAGFDVLEMREPDFKMSLVEIEAANVVKGFCKEPEIIEKPCPDCDHREDVHHCFDPCHSHHERVTEGHELGHCWRDARPVLKMVLLGRVGRFLSRLAGQGVLWLDGNGMVSVLKDIPLKVTHLWHQWFKPTPTGAPVIGQPMPFPYQVISDLDGVPHVIQGLSGDDSVTIWDHAEQLFYQRPVTDFPLSVRRKLKASQRLEIVGFDPLPTSGNASDLRELKHLSGEGMIYFHKEATAPGSACECGSCPTQLYTTVAEFVPNPTNSGSCPMILAFVNGRPQWVRPDTIDCLKGTPGKDGNPGPSGRDGRNGSVGTYNTCGC